MSKNLSETDFEDLFVFTAKLEEQLGREVTPEEVSFFQGIAETEALRQCLSEGLRSAQDSWNYDVPDDYEYAQSFQLISVEYEFLLDWLSNQRDYERLAKSGIDECEAHHLAKYDRKQLRKKAHVVSDVAQERTRVEVAPLLSKKEPPVMLKRPLEVTKRKGRQNTSVANKNSAGKPSFKRRSKMTFGKAFEMFMDLHARPHLEVRDYYAKYYRRHLQSFSETLLTDISKLCVSRLHSQIGAENGKVEANRTLETMRTVFNKMIDWDLFRGTNPAARFRAYREIPRERFLQPSELKKFFDALSDLRSRDAQDFFLLALFTGARKSNILEMKWSDVKLEDCTWKILKTKNGSPQTVTLVPQAIEVLKRRNHSRSLSDFVFPASIRSGHFQNPYKSWKRLKEEAGFSERLTIHDLRRSLASWQAMTGANLTVIGATLNHTDPKSTAIYARVNLEPVRQTMETAVNAMLNVGKQIDDSTT